MLRSMRILLVSSLALAAPILANAAESGDGDRPMLTDQDQAQREAKAKALALATEACDKGAAIPLDPGAKAPPVHFLELHFRDFDKAKLQALLSACQQAWAGAPKNGRLQLQWLRVMVMSELWERDRHWLLVPQLKIFADQGSAEAQYLIHMIQRLHQGREGEAAPPVSQADALAYLRKAAEQGHLDAMAELMLIYRNGKVVRTDLKQAVKMARRIESAPPQGISETRHEAGIKERMRIVGVRMTLQGEGFSLAERRVAFAVVEKDSEAGTNANSTALDYIEALRFGRGTAKNPTKARQLLEARIAAGRYGVPAYADMLAHGEGGPADPKKALALLRDVKLKRDSDAAHVLADLLLDGKSVGRQPREAIRLLDSSWKLEDKIRLAGLLCDYKVSIDDPKRLIGELATAADLGEPGAALALAKLKLSENSQFRDVDGGRALLKPLADAGDREALWLYAASQYTNLDSSSSQSYLRGDGLSEDDLKRLIDEGMAKNEPQAFLLRAVLLRKGVLYPQDDQAATAMLISAANLGSVEAMVLLGHAYDEGLGVPRNARERLRVWREAAKRGSIAARQNLVNSFPFDMSDRQMTLEEGVTDALVLFINGVDRLPYGVFTGRSDTDIRVGRIFKPGSRAMEEGVPAVTDAVMNAFRQAPAGLEERMLVEIGKVFPDEIRIAIERKLQSEGFYSGQPEGYFGPEVRKALAAWVDAKGPVAETVAVETKQDDTPQAKKDDLIDPGMLARVRDRAFREGIAAKTDRQKLTALSALNALAQYGDMAPRWALVRNYHQARVVRKIVSPAEITRYGLDVLVTKPPSAEKADFEFIFDVSQIYKDGQIRAFGTAMLTTIRDDQRLQDPLTLGGILQHLTFAPGACDAILAAAKKARVKDIGQEGCDETTMSALIAFAKARGPAGVDAKARQAAVMEIKAMDAEARN